MGSLAVALWLIASFVLFERLYYTESCTVLIPNSLPLSNYRITNKSFTKMDASLTCCTVTAQTTEPTIPVTRSPGCISAERMRFFFDSQLHANDRLHSFEHNLLATFLQLKIQQHKTSFESHKHKIHSDQTHRLQHDPNNYQHHKAFSSSDLTPATMHSLRITDAHLAVIRYCLEDLKAESEDAAAIFNDVFLAEIRDTGEPLFASLDIQRARTVYKLSDAFVRAGGLAKYMPLVKEATKSMNIELASGGARTAGQTRGRDGGSRGAERTQSEKGKSTRRPDDKENAKKVTFALDGAADEVDEGKKLLTLSKRLRDRGHVPPNIRSCSLEKHPFP